VSKDYFCFFNPFCIDIINTIDIKIITLEKVNILTTLILKLIYIPITKASIHKDIVRRNILDMDLLSCSEDNL